MIPDYDAKSVGKWKCLVSIMEGIIMSVKIKYASGVKHVIEHGQAVIIGAGKVGKSLVDEMEEICGCAQNYIKLILDNDENKSGTLYKGIEIIAIKDAVSVLEPCALIIAVKSYKEILRQINQIHEFDGWDCYIYPLM